MPGCRTWQEVAGAGAGLLLNRDSPQARGLLGWWPLNETGGLIAFDRFNRRHNGTLVNGPLRVVTTRGHAVDLDGTDDHVNLGPNLDVTGTALFISCFVTPQGTPGGSVYPRIVERATTYPALQYSIVLQALTTKPLFDLYLDGALAASMTAATALALNTESHLVATYDGAYRRIYVNGRLDNELATTGSITSVGARDTWIGNYSPAGGNAFNGLVRDMRIGTHIHKESGVWATYRNPWDLYWRKSRSAPKNTVAGGGGSIRVKMHHYKQMMGAN